MVGAAASAAGFGLGVAAAHGMHRLLPALGVQLPSTPVTVHGSVALVALAVGTTVTVLAALVPAFRATGPADGRTARTVEPLPAYVPAGRRWCSVPLPWPGSRSPRPASHVRASRACASSAWVP